MERPRRKWAGSWSYEWPAESCAGCGKPVTGNQYARINDEGKPYHWDCDPDLPKEPEEEPELTRPSVVSWPYSSRPKPKSLRKRVVELAHRFRF